MKGINFIEVVVWTHVFFSLLLFVQLLSIMFQVERMCQSKYLDRFKVEERFRLTVTITNVLFIIMISMIPIINILWGISLGLQRDMFVSRIIIASQD